MSVVDIAFVQDWDAEVHENGAPEWGDWDAMAEYLAQWDFGQDTDDAHTEETSPAGKSDEEFRVTVGGLEYTLNVNSRFGYAGLVREPLEVF